MIYAEHIHGIWRERNSRIFENTRRTTEQIAREIACVCNVRAQDGPQREKSWYFFTGRKRRYKNGRKPNRQVIGKKGYWKATGVDSEVKYNGQIVGYKMTLDFYEQNGVKSQWKMHEYRLDRKSSLPHANSSIEYQELDKYVLCEIYINTKAKNVNKRSKRENDSEDLPTDDDESMNSPNNDSIIQDTDSTELSSYSSILSDINMYPYEAIMEHENSIGFTPNILASSNYDQPPILREREMLYARDCPSNYDQISNFGDGNFHGFQGFDELGAVIKHLFPEMKNEKSI
ncbi:PREDICTED: NAC domain-containing protein 19-like [Nicotiana attenuata]|uniref:NAC domain-containing protein 19-like n=1 Tax=Nicotiana attenuata TaxID=49451 RepID=UPI000905ACC3|nr:PREDICTED: NAC domain-containing protein 19-like [Nicotiana attenuata]